MAEIVPILALRFDRSLLIDEQAQARSLFTQWSGHVGVDPDPSFRLAQARLLRAEGDTKSSRKAAQQLLEEGLQPQDEAYVGACLLAGSQLPRHLLGAGGSQPFWVEMELQRWQDLSPKPNRLVQRAEDLGDATYLACAWLVATESWLRLEQDEPFKSAWGRADELLRALPAPRLFPRLELLGVIGHFRAERADEASRHLERGRSTLSPDQEVTSDRFKLWSALLHLDRGRLEDAQTAIATLSGARQKSLLLGHWAGQAALAWAEGDRTESRERLVRFAVADDQLAVGSLSALGFLLWLADATEAAQDLGSSEAALRAALRTAGRSGLARTVAELDDRLRELGTTGSF